MSTDEQLQRLQRHAESLPASWDELAFYRAVAMFVANRIDAISETVADDARDQADALAQDRALAAGVLRHLTNDLAPLDAILRLSPGLDMADVVGALGRLHAAGLARTEHGWWAKA